MVDQAEDLLNDDTMAALEEVVLSGKVRMILGPPCCTFSVMRHFPLPDGREGPCPLRGLYGDRRFAFEGLTDWELRRVKGDTILVFRMFWLQLLGEVVARRRRIRRPKFLMEHPEDPDKHMDGPEKDEYPSIKTWPELEMMTKLLGLSFWRFDQGPLGHPRRNLRRF